MIGLFSPLAAPEPVWTVAALIIVAAVLAAGVLLRSGE